MRSQPRCRTRRAAIAAVVACVAAAGLRAPVVRGGPAEDDATPFGAALVAGDRALAGGDLDEARRQVVRALERDPKSPRAWDLRARVAAAGKDADEHGYALHRLVALRVAQKAPAAEVKSARARLEAADPWAKDVLALDRVFLDGLVGVLFHEAAHQFVGLATTAAGWMNEGLASYFEGTRILANGTVVMNLPANHRLFPLVEKMSRGWMSSAADGIDPAAPAKSDPPKAPTFRIVLENEYAWGPPWYAPTWGVVYFLWNYQDPADGRFLYREAFRQYVDASGGKVGKTAIKTFEDVVLAHPSAPTRGVAEAKANKARLPRTVDEVDEVWKAWLTDLRDEQIGRKETHRPYLAWARHAIARKDHEVATEHFEKGVGRFPDDPDLLLEFAEHLVARERNRDRAGHLAEHALRVLEAAPAPDARRVAAVEARLLEWDPSRRTLDATHRELWAAAQSIARRYAEEGKPLLTMHVARTFGADLGVPGLDALYEQAARSSGRTLALWRLAYDERSLAGWAPDGGGVFSPYGTILRAKLGKYAPDDYAMHVLPCDAVTSGDFSFEAEVRVERAQCALAGLVFGRKSATSFHALVLFPEGFLDLASFVDGAPKVWRHHTVAPSKDAWRRLRVDVAGSTVDAWLDGEPVATQDFGDPDVLRGAFGLFTGVGACEFRAVRTLLRARNDPGARIEREARLRGEKAAGAPVAGSYLGLVPPFPVVETWFGAPRARWDERGPVPTLLVLWSRKQNERIPLHAWLSELATRHASTGLEIVSVCENTDAATVRAYLAEHPFPGAVGLDAYEQGRTAAGTTLDAYFVGTRFPLPRLVLLDVDGRVVWEGAPGFELDRPWKTGEPSYLDTPLEDLVRRRSLAALRAWLATWQRVDGRAAVASGALDPTLSKCLLDARTLPGDVVADVAWAQARARTIDDAISAFEKSGDAITAAGAEPAVAELLAWAALLGRPQDPQKVRGIRRAASSANASAWRSALALCDRAQKDLAAGAAAATVATALVGRLAKLPGALPKALADALVAAGGDAAAVSRELSAAPRRPARWLAEWLRL